MYLPGEMSVLGPGARTSYWENYESDQRIKFMLEKMKDFGVYRPKLEQNNKNNCTHWINEI